MTKLRVTLPDGRVFDMPDVRENRAYYERLNRHASNPKDRVKIETIKVGTDTVNKTDIEVNTSAIAETDNAKPAVRAAVKAGKKQAVKTEQEAAKQAE